MKEIAEMAAAYVAYLSFARKDSTAYPGRSLMADQFFIHRRRPDVTALTECYVSASTINVAICKRLGIAPIGYFDLQVLPEYREFQEEFGKHVDAMYQMVKDSGKKQNIDDGLSRERSGDDFFRISRVCR